MLLTLERNIVVKVIGDDVCLSIGHVRRSVVIATSVTEHLHTTGDDLSGVAVAAVFALPLPGLQTAFDVYLRSLLQIVGGNLAKTATPLRSSPVVCKNCSKES